MKELQVIRRSNSFLENKIQCYQDEGRKPWIIFGEEDFGQHQTTSYQNLIASLIASVAVLQMAERKKP